MKACQKSVRVSLKGLALSKLGQLEHQKHNYGNGSNILSKRVCESIVIKNGGVRGDILQE